MRAHSLFRNDFIVMSHRRKFSQSRPYIPLCHYNAHVILYLGVPYAGVAGVVDAIIFYAQA